MEGKRYRLNLASATSTVTLIIKHQPTSNEELLRMFDFILVQVMVDVFGIQMTDELMIILKGNNRSFGIPMTRFSELTPQTIIDKIAGVPSGSEFVIEEIDLVWVGSMSVYRGGCVSEEVKGANELKEDWYRKRNRSIVRLENDDNMCLARSLVLLKEYHSGEKGMKQFQKLRRTDRTKQLTEQAKALCEQVKWDASQPVPFNELHRFCTALQIRISVVSSEGFRIVFAEKPRRAKTNEAEQQAETAEGDEKQSESHQTSGVVVVECDQNEANEDEHENETPRYHVLWTGNHYEPILKPQHIVAGDYANWCFNCDKGYNGKNHRCTDACTACSDEKCEERKHQPHDPSERKWKQCQECWRYFPCDRNESCYANHKRNGTCERVWKCEKCKRTMMRAKEDPKNRCG